MPLRDRSEWSESEKASVPKFYFPQGLHITKEGDILVADTMNHCIRNTSKFGEVTTIAGQPPRKLKERVNGYLNGPKNISKFFLPTALCVREGIIYVCDSANHAIRRIYPNGTVDTFVGGIFTRIPNPGEETLSNSLPGYRDGKGTFARFNEPVDIKITRRGNILVADRQNHVIRKVTPEGLVTTFAGTPYQTGLRDGALDTAKFDEPTGIAIHPKDGSIYIADRSNHRIRKICFGNSERYIDREEIVRMQMDAEPDLMVATARRTRAREKRRKELRDLFGQSTDSLEDPDNYLNFPRMLEKMESHYGY